MILVPRQVLAAPMDDLDLDSEDFENPGFTFSVPPQNRGFRLDQYLAQVLTQLSRSQISEAIRNGTIRINGRPGKSSLRLRGGEEIIGHVPAPPPLQVFPEAIDFPVLLEDEHLLFLAKPPDLVVHPGSGNHRGTLVNGLVHYCRQISAVGVSDRPGIVHRLDKDTSGVMVVAKSPLVHRLLVDVFKERQVEKTYCALVHGRLAEPKGRLVGAIGRHPRNRQKMAVLEQGGRFAATSWRTAFEIDKYSLLRLTIETGRTHQIRVHLAHLGHPVAGDCLYGSGRDNSTFPRQLLHAARLRLKHPLSGKLLDVAAPLWPDFVDCLTELGLERKQLAEFL